MKCATSTLHMQLAKQPGIFMSTPKEPNFFSDDRQWHRGLDWYSELFAAAPSGALRGESSTHYTKLPTYPATVQRIHRVLPSVKLIYVIRHPIERLVSHYIHAWTENLIDEPIDSAIECYAELVAYSEYSRQLAPYLELYGADQIRIVMFERLLHDSQYALNALLQFLGYTGNATWHTEEAHHNASRERLRRCAWRDTLVHAPVLAQLRKHLVPRKVREAIKALWRLNERPVVSPSRLSSLTDIFDRDLARLGEWCGVQISCRTFRQVAFSHDVLLKPHVTLAMR